VYDASDDPRALVEVTWTEVAEGELLMEEGADNGDPRNVTPSVLGRLDGVQVQGVLRGIGWNGSFDPPSLTADGCDDSDRSPGLDGDWSGDVDFLVVDIGEAEGALLCTHVILEDPDLGWDLLLYPLDACGLPLPPVRDPAGEVPLGFQRRGGAGGWKIPVEQGARYAVLLAGYDAAEPVAEYGYHLGAAVIPGAGGAELCPMLPIERGGAE
jgi:hypothetical protein